MYNITLITIICYVQSSHCIIVTFQTCTEQQHIGGFNTQNGNKYIYIYMCVCVSKK